MRLAYTKWDGDSEKKNAPSRQDKINAFKTEFIVKHNLKFKKAKQCG